ncbi:MAG: ATP/GTP-binding protein [Candidatus Brockarchaeota archaeon]|nr:ATP/GTP-binding protein [Candidatus Brockarchaeota archaeon]
MNIVMTGLAGAGKSQLTCTLGEWLKEDKGFEVCYVNLDAGAEWLPYKPDVDVRGYVRVDRIMREMSLGINGAIIAAADMAAQHLDEIASKISAFDPEFVLVDSPGQYEIFVFRESGPKTAQALQKLGKTVALNVIDAELASSPSALLTALELSTASNLRLGVTTINVVNKADLGGAERVKSMLSDPKLMREEVERERGGAITDLALGLLEHMERVMSVQRPVLVSALKGDGIEDLYKAVNEAMCACGDLT